MVQEDQGIYNDFLIWAINYTVAEAGEWKGKGKRKHRSGTVCSYPNSFYPRTKELWRRSCWMVEEGAAP